MPGMFLWVCYLCGWIMLICILVIAAKQIPVVKDWVGNFALVFWAEAIALCAFGAAWIVAGKYLAIFTEPEEKLALLKPKIQVT